MTEEQKSARGPPSHLGLASDYKLKLSQPIIEFIQESAIA